MLDIFSRACQSFVYLLWRNVSSNLLIFHFLIGLSFFYCCLKDFFVRHNFHSEVKMHNFCVQFDEFYLSVPPNQYRGHIQHWEGLLVPFLVNNLPPENHSSGLSHYGSVLPVLELDVNGIMRDSDSICSSVAGFFGPTLDLWDSAIL